MFHNFYIYSDYNLLLGGLVLILTPCVLILTKILFYSVVSKYIETAHLFYGFQCLILPCYIIRFPLFVCLFVCFFLKYNVIIKQINNPWFLKTIETVHLFHGFQCPIWSCCTILFPFPCVFAGER